MALPADRTLSGKAIKLEPLGDFANSTPFSLPETILESTSAAPEYVEFWRYASAVVYRDLSCAFFEIQLSQRHGYCKGWGKYSTAVLYFAFTCLRADQ